MTTTTVGKARNIPEKNRYYIPLLADLALLHQERHELSKYLFVFVIAVLSGTVA